MTEIGRIKIDQLPTMRDARGALTAVEFDKLVPFPVVRLFYVWDVPAGTQRGRHGHRRCSQYMICVQGKLSITVSDGKEWCTFDLGPGSALLVKPGIFAAETYRHPGTVLLVLCDRPYEKEDYVSSLDELRE